MGTGDRDRGGGEGLGRFSNSLHSLELNQQELQLLKKAHTTATGEDFLVKLTSSIAFCES